MTDLTEVHGKGLMSFITRKFSGSPVSHDEHQLSECIHGGRILLSRMILYFNPGQTSAEFHIFKSVQDKNRATVSYRKLS